MNSCKVIAICNQKGGVGKTSTALNLSVGLAMHGKNVLAIDLDPQADLTSSFGWNPDKINLSIADFMDHAIRDEVINLEKGILHHEEGVDLIPSNIDLANKEISLVNAMSREYTLRTCLESGIKKDYDYMVIDCPPTLGMITINALAASNSVIIPVQAQYLPAKGMTQLIKTIGMVKSKFINPNIQIEGVLLTLSDNRTKLAKATEAAIKENYGNKIKVFDTIIPMSVKVAEAPTTGRSIFSYDIENKSAAKLGYMNFTKEVLLNGKTRNKSKSTLSR